MRDEEIVRVIEDLGSEGSKVLEVGFGSGRIAIEVARTTGFTVYGVESSRFAVAQASDRAVVRGVSNRVIFLKQLAESLSFPEAFFDLVYSVKALHETRAVESLREMHRVLRDEGKLVIIDWIKGAMRWTREHYFSPKELEETVKKNGFKVLTLRVLNNKMLLIAEKNETHKSHARKTTMF